MASYYGRILVAGVVLFLATLGAASVSASPAIDDPIVSTAVDNTALSNCVRTVTTTPYSSSSTTSTSLPCPNGTVVEPKNIKLSEAVALHEPYALIPENSASVETRKKYHDEVIKLLDLKADKVRIPISKTSQSMLHPNINCGSTFTISDGWSDGSTGSTTFNSLVTYTKTADCNAIFISSASQGSSQNTYGWDKMKYANSTWDPNCPSFGSGSYSTYYINTSQNLGYYFVDYIAEGTPCSLWSDVNHGIGPLN